MTLPTSGLLPSGLTPAILNPAGLFVGGAWSSGGAPALFTLKTSLTEGSGGYRGVTHPANDSADYARLVPDHENVWRGVKQNASRHYGSRLVINHYTASEDLNNAVWIEVGGAPPTVSADGEEVAFGTGGSSVVRENVAIDNAVIGTKVIISAEMKVDSGTDSCFLHIVRNDLGTLYSPELTVTSEWQRFSHTYTATVAGNLGGGVGYVTGSGEVIRIRNLQFEVVDGRLDTTTPSEYVSTGVLSAPFHGNNVDGQKSFATERNALTISKTVQEFTANGDNSGYVDLDGTGDYVSTPDSVASSITGDIDIRALIQSDDWSVAQRIISKWGVGTSSYYFALVSGRPQISWIQDDTTQITESSITPLFSGNDVGWVRVTLDVDNGASGNDVKFYSSVDGMTWTQTGSTITTAGVTNIRDGDTQVTVGIDGNLSSLPFDGKIYRAQIFNEIDGTVPVVDFNPGKDSSENDTSFTSSTGEVWTTQADASLHKKGLPLGRNLISNNGLANDTLIGTGGNFQDNLGDELVTNGAFATDTDWTKQTGWTIAALVASCDGTQTGASSLFQNNALSEVPALGSTFLVTFTISNYSAGSIYPRLANSDITDGTTRNADGTYTQIYTVTNTPINQNINLVADADFIGDIDNVSVKEVTEGSTGWTGNDSEAIIIEADGNLRVTNGDATAAQARTTITTVTNKVYTVFLNYGSVSSTPRIYVGTSAGGTQLYDSGTSFSNNSIETFTFTATGTTTHITLTFNTAAISVSFELKGIYITPGIPLSGLMMEGAATNLITQPRDLTNAAWTAIETPSAALDAVGVDGKPNSASTLTDNNGVDFEGVEETVTVTADTNDVLFSVRVKKDTDVSRFVVIRARLLTSGTDTQDYIHLNTSTGAIVEAGATGAGFSAYGVIDAGDWWLIYATITNTNNTNARLYLYPAGSTVIGTLVGTATGSAIFDAASIQENTSYPTSPILATGAATRPSDTEYTLDVNNWPDATGSLEMDMTPFFSNALSGSPSLIAPNGGVASTLYFTTVAKRMSLYDGTNFNTPTTDNWSVSSQTIKIKERHNSSTSKMQWSFDGTPSTEAAYDGSFQPSGAITLGTSLTQGLAIKNLKIYRRDKGSAWLASS